MNNEEGRLHAGGHRRHLHPSPQQPGEARRGYAQAGGCGVGAAAASATTRVRRLQRWIANQRDNDQCYLRYEGGKFILPSVFDIKNSVEREISEEPGGVSLAIISC